MDALKGEDNSIKGYYTQSDGVSILFHASFTIHVFGAIALPFPSSHRSSHAFYFSLIAVCIGIPSGRLAPQQRINNARERLVMVERVGQTEGKTSKL